MSLSELQQNPLVQRVIDIFDTDQNGEVDFKGKRAFLVHLMLNSIANSFDGFVNVPLTSLSPLSEFIQGVSQFSVRGDKESKLKCTFATFDSEI